MSLVNWCVMLYGLCLLFVFVCDCVCLVDMFVVCDVWCVGMVCVIKCVGAWFNNACVLYASV